MQTQVFDAALLEFLEEFVVAALGHARNSPIGCHFKYRYLWYIFAIMLKRLLIAVVAAAVVAGVLVAVYYQRRNAVSEGFEINCTQDSSPSSTSTSLTCKIDPALDADHSKHKAPWWNVLLAWPEGITAWLLMLTLGAIVWQAWETRKAAESAERQISLQSIAMSQWVNIEPIKTVTPPAFHNPVEVVLEFQVLNKTDYLLTVKKIEAEVFYGGKARIFKVLGSDPVPPEKSSAEGGLPFYLTLFADRSTWHDIGALFFVGGEVTYLDCMDIERTQEFRDMFNGYEDGRLIRKRPSGQVPEVEDYKAKNEESKMSDSKHAWFSWAIRKLKRAPRPS